MKYEGEHSEYGDLEKHGYSCSEDLALIEKAHG
jgi:hypothetical protein